MADDLLKRTTQEIRDRLKQLEPLVREHERLRRALSALTGSDETPKRQQSQGQPQRARKKQTKRAGRGERPSGSKARASLRERERSRPSGPVVVSAVSNC
jgi:hypothetical protein